MRLVILSFCLLSARVGSQPVLDFETDMAHLNSLEVHYEYKLFRSIRFPPGPWEEGVEFVSYQSNDILRSVPVVWRMPDPALGGPLWSKPGN